MVCPALADSGCNISFPHSPVGPQAQLSKTQLLEMWCSRCQTQVRRAWHNNELAKDKTFVCSFTVNKGGLVVDLKVKTSSGSEIVDSLIVQTIKDAAPSPANYSLENFAAELTFVDRNAPKFKVTPAVLATHHNPKTMN